MHSPADMCLWHGRCDPEAGGERWHQMVKPLAPSAPESGEPGVVLLGVCSDIGVRRNQGRPGAAKGPDAIRAALANQAWHLPGPCYDAGNLFCTGDDLEGLQEEQSFWVGRLLDLGHFPLLLGGGHELAFGSHLGLRGHLERRGGAGVVGIVNFDAHFDLRSSQRSTSGTPFLQIAERCQREGAPFRYLCLGISESANTLALFRRAASLGAQWLSDEELSPWKIAAARERLLDFLAGCDQIHLSIDLDLLPAPVAPGVSAPSPRGVSLEVVEELLRLIRSEGGARLELAEIVECNPEFDGEGRTARVAARLCHILTRKDPGSAASGPIPTPRLEPDKEPPHE